VKEWLRWSMVIRVSWINLLSTFIFLHDDHRLTMIPTGNTKFPLLLLVVDNNGQLITISSFLWFFSLKIGDRYVVFVLACRWRDTVGFGGSDGFIYVHRRENKEAVKEPLLVVMTKSCVI
jgi:hypothetical protein